MDYTPTKCMDCCSCCAGDAYAPAGWGTTTPQAMIEAKATRDHYVGVSKTLMIPDNWFISEGLSLSKS